METVVITGSRIQVSSAFDAPTPVTVVGADDIKFSGSQNINGLLDQMPGFVASRNGGSFSNNVQGNGFGGSTFANLRGLNSSQSSYDAVRSLVLVNGRRFTVQSAYLVTDMNTIPTDLVQRTEVVTGGSSAVYGSDAIAGVINFIIKDDFEGAKASAHSRWDSMTGTPEYSFDVTVGGNFDHDKGNVAIAMNYLNRDSVQRDQLDYAKYNLNPGCTTSLNTRGASVWNGAGAPCPTGSVLGLTTWGSGDTPTGHITTTNSALLPGGAGAPVGSALYNAWVGAGLGAMGSNGWTNDAGDTLARPWLAPPVGGAVPLTAPWESGDRYNLTQKNYVQIPQERWMINAFAHYDIARWMTAYTEMNFSNNAVVMHLTPSNNNATLLVRANSPFATGGMGNVFAALDAVETGSTCSGWKYGTQPTATVPCTVANDGIAAISYGRRFVEVGDRNDEMRRVGWRFAGGLKGILGNVNESFLKDLAYDVSYMYTQTYETDRTSGVVSRQKFQQAVLDGTCNPFGAQLDAAATPNCLSTISLKDFYSTFTKQAGALMSLTGTAFDLPAGPLQFAVGGEWRDAYATYDPDWAMTNGDIIGFNASAPTKGGLSVKEVFGELRIPVLADLPMIEAFTVNGAARLSDYSVKGTGTVWTYTTGADWKVVEDLRFRGQYQHAIRAPNPGELYAGSSVNFNIQPDPCGPASTYIGSAREAAVKTLCVAQNVPSANVFQNVVQSSNLIGNVTGGNVLLKAESSDTITFGAVVMPQFVPGLGLTIDWYSIIVKDAIGPLSGGLAGILNGCFGTTTTAGTSPSFCTLINRDPATGQITSPYYVQTGTANQGSIKTQGIDLGAVYAFGVDWGLLESSSDFNIGSTWTWQLESKTISNPDQPQNWQQCKGAFGSTCGEPNPALKGSTRVTWHDGQLALSFRWRYLGGATDDRYLLAYRNPNLGAPTPLASIAFPKIGEFNYFDLSFSYDVNENLQFSGGVNNIFNIAPPIVSAGNNNANTYPATYDPLGQTLFLNLVARTN